MKNLMEKTLRFAFIAFLCAYPLTDTSAAQNSAHMADINGDCILDQADVNEFLTHFSQRNIGMDLTQDGRLDIDDVNLFLHSFAAAVNDPALICDREIPTLIPGDGWNGPTLEPAAIGSPDMTGYDARAIARWDVVPYQTFDNMFEIGVVAFHITGIDRVEFSVDSGPWASTNTMTLNPRTQTWEYTAALDPSRFENNQFVEVRAIIYPNVGMPRVLAGQIGPNNPGFFKGEHSLFLTANPAHNATYYVSADGSDHNNGTLSSPFKTINHAITTIHQQQNSVLDGGVVNLLPGSYSNERTSKMDSFNRPLTIQGAPGTNREDVILTGLEDIRTNLLAINDVTVIGKISQDQSEGRMLFLNNVDIIAPGMTDQTFFFVRGEYPSGMYITNSTYKESGAALRAFSLIRNTHLSNLSVDAFKNPELIVNSKVTDLINIWNCDVGSDNTCPHRDTIQWGGDKNAGNIIIYGLRAHENVQAKAIQSKGSNDEVRLDDVAIVNFSTWPSSVSNWNYKSNHLLFDHTVFYNHIYAFRSAELTNFRFQNSLAKRVWYDEALYGPAAQSLINNHFSNPNNHIGLNTTSGDPKFIDANNFDFRPRAESPLVNRDENPLAPIDLDGHIRPAFSAVGAFEPRTDTP